MVPHGTWASLNLFFHYRGFELFADQTQTALMTWHTWLPACHRGTGGPRRQNNREDSLCVTETWAERTVLWESLGRCRTGLLGTVVSGCSAQEPVFNHLFSPGNVTVTPCPPLILQVWIKSSQNLIYNLRNDGRRCRFVRFLWWNKWIRLYVGISTL